MDITILLPLALGLTALSAAIYWFFILPRKKNNLNNRTSNNTEAKASTEDALNRTTNKKLSPEELLNKAWEFLTIIAEKVLKMSSTTQNDILNIGKKLKDNGMIFTVMVDDGSSIPPKSPAKERAAREQKGLKSSQQKAK